MNRASESQTVTEQVRRNRPSTSKHLEPKVEGEGGEALQKLEETERPQESTL